MEGMPEVIAELEDEVDTVARTSRWIEGGDGLVQVLEAEKYNFKTFGGQIMAKDPPPEAWPIQCGTF